MHEKENMWKARYAAEDLKCFLRTIQATTRSVAVEELMTPALEQVNNISRLLIRLIEEKK